MEMMDCRKAQNEIDQLIAGEIDEASLENLDRHCERCEECRDHRALVEEIAADRSPEPDELSLAAVRRGVMQSVRREAGSGRAWYRYRHAAAIGLVTAGAALFALGWLAGQSAGARTGTGGAGGLDPDFEFASYMQSVARESAGNDHVRQSGFRYANVRIEEGEGDEVRLAFDVSRHLELTLPKQNPLVTEVLVQSLLDSGSVGTKLKAIDHAVDLLDPRVRGALVKAMLDDPNLGVRLQAQARLIEQPGDSATADAMLSVLEKESSVQMRLIAIDYLTRSRVDPERLRQAVESGDPEGRGAVRVKASDYILQL
ncbi:MAG TPA: hypothetical protein VM557_08925 [Thermoanaerobaculia bacterium]|nr:hypothetical protein [Thermoanaerobaculia bacterium]